MKKNEYTTETPVFSERLDILDPTDPGHADILNPINKQIFENTLYLKGKINEYIGNTDNPDSGMGFVEGIKADNVVGAINEVFQSGNEKKQKLVSNLVAMGIEADTSDTWETLLDKILDMTDTSSDTVTTETLLEGYTAHNAAGELITGTIPEKAGTTVNTTGVTQDSSYTYFGVPEGHYDENSKVRAINSDLLDDIYNAFVAAGVTPTAKTSEALIAAVTTLKQQASANPTNRAIPVRGEIVNDGVGEFQGIRIKFLNTNQYAQVHNQQTATWYLNQMI